MAFPIYFEDPPPYPYYESHGPQSHGPQSHHPQRNIDDFDYVSATMTPEEFDAKATDSDCISISRNSWSAIGRAAARGNVSLVEHIVKRARNGSLVEHICKRVREDASLVEQVVKTTRESKEYVLRIDHNKRETPLFIAVSHSQYATTQKLMELGADVNGIAPIISCPSNSLTPFGATPLWAALEKTNNTALVKLLLKGGAMLAPQDETIVPPKLSDRAQAFADRIDQELKNEVEETIDNGYFHALSLELTTIITGYYTRF